MQQIVRRLGLCPRPNWGSLHRSLDTIAGLGVGPTGNGKEGGEGKGQEGGGRPGIPKSRVGEATRPVLLWPIVAVKFPCIRVRTASCVG